MHGTFKNKVDVFSLDSLIAWLESRDPDETYCYIDNGKCLLAQYFEAKGYKNVNVFSNCFTHGHIPIQELWNLSDFKKQREKIDLPVGFNHVALGNVNEEDYVISKALDRARKIRSRSFGIGFLKGKKYV